ncbi:beta-ketoacyl synthase N-terminal-like domain-containing protein, partial [Okeania hirsuta]
MAEGKPYLKLDASTIMAIDTALQATKGMQLNSTQNWGVNVGSSRGATQILENAHLHHIEGQDLSPNTSPLTTLGNVSSWVAQRLGVEALSISHSVTCGSALQSIANGISWLESGRCDHFLAGGTEAPLTPFTKAQMEALRIYAAPEETSYPCRALDLNKEKNSMVLGEAAASFVLTSQSANAPMAWIKGIGYAMEPLSSPTSISESGIALQKAMQMALQEAELEQVDVIVSHTPGTIRGDQAEYHAIQQV